MNAFVLMGGCVDDRHVIGVFSSMQKAEEEKARLISVNKYYETYPDDLDIDVCEMDKSKLKPDFASVSEMINDKKREISSLKEALKGDLTCREQARLQGRLYILEKQLAELILNNLDNINIT